MPLKSFFHTGKRAHFSKDVILTGVRWYMAYLLSTRHVEELMEERGVTVDHATINRWVTKYSPQLVEAFHRRKRPLWFSWRLDETYRLPGCLITRQTGSIISNRPHTKRGDRASNIVGPLIGPRT